MGLDSAELEGCVEELYTRAGYDDGEIDTPARIARALFGEDCIHRVRLARSLGATGKLHGKPIIAVKAGLPSHVEQFVIGHELGHHALGDYKGEDIETACDYIGAALMTRRKPFAWLARGKERDFRQLAFDFETTETMVALRVGEVLGLHVAVVTPRMVRARGGEWPDEQGLRELARKGALGLSRIKLTDDRRRVALVGDEADAA